MFGINDSNQNTNSPAPADKPAVSQAGLPPSPFMDSPTEPTSPAPPPDAMPSPMPTQSVSPSQPVEPPATTEMSSPDPSPNLNPIPSPSPASDPSPSTAQNQDQLVSLKSQALSSLAPLVNHLDQSPEEKFKTTMMLIQASDDSSLVKDAYEAANEITDEKARAQALLDVVNEINYFTQKEDK